MSWGGVLRCEDKQRSNLDNYTCWRRSQTTKGEFKLVSRSTFTLLLYLKKKSAEGDEFEMRARGEEKCLYGASLFPPCGGRVSRERAKVSARKESGAHYLTEKQPFPFFFLMQLSSFATLTTRAVLTFFQSKTTVFLPSAFIFPDVYTAHCICK